MTEFKRPFEGGVEWHEKNSNEIESIEDAVLEYIIGESRAINSGNNGIIFLIKLQDFPDLAKTLGPDAGDKVFKLLKVYRKGEGQREYDIQRSAYEIVENAPNRKELANIPKPLLFRDLGLHQPTVDRLKKMGADTDDNVEILLMDLVDGRDLATIFDEWIIENANPDEIKPRSQGFEELHATVSQILKFETAGKKSVRAGDRVYEERKVQMGNADKLYNTLKKTGFKIDANISTKLQKTIRLLHENGIYHNDPHERNFMINEAGEPFIVDFGAASNEPSEERVSDEYIVNRLKQLGEVEAKNNSEYDSLLQRLKKDKTWNSEYEQIKNNLPLSLTELENKLLISTSNELKFSKNLATLHALMNDELIEKEKIQNILKNFLLKKNLPTWAYNKAKNFLEAI